MLDTIKLQLEKQYETLGHKEGDITELRILPQATSYYCKTKQEFVDLASSIINDGSHQLYVGINPRNKEAPGTLDSVNRITCLVIDVDPVRPKGTSSTKEQLKAAIELGTRIQEDLRGGVVVSSGSGCHVYLPIVDIAVKNAEHLSNSLKKWSDAIKEKYGTKELKIDSIFDLPRIIRVWGSYNSKSNRTCMPLSSLESIIRFKYEFSQEAPKAVEVPTNTDELTQKFQRLCKTNKRLRELVDGAIAPGEEGRSGLDFEFVGILTRSQFSATEIQKLMPYNVLGGSKKSGSKEEMKDIIRIMDKFQEAKDTKAYSLTNNSSSYYESIRNRKMGIRCGFKTLDEMISGFKEGKIYIFGARPGTGKTTFVTQMLTHMAEHGIPSLFFPTEVGAEPIIDKIISWKAGISLKKFQNGTFTEEDVSKIEKTKDFISSLPLTIYEDFGLDIDRYEQEIDKYAPKVVVLDYFQALKWKDSSNLGEKEEAVRRLKKITKDRNIVTICLSQLNRGTQGSSGKAAMAELKGTAALEELADVIGQMYTGEGLGYPIPVDLVVTKSKYSATGSIALKFDKTTAHFIEDEVQPNA